MGCPFKTLAGFINSTLRPGLPPLTEKIAELPIDDRGYPVPAFVAWIDGKPDFRIIDPRFVVKAVRENLCWVCGFKHTATMTYVIGPMCAINRISSEPPSHPDCAEWSAKGCPFLSKPQMVRREDETIKQYEGNVAGIAIKRNPGVTLLWHTSDPVKYFLDRGRPLFEVGNPIKADWYREGRTATRQECIEAIESGYPQLRELCDGDIAALSELTDRKNAAWNLLPPT